MKPVHRPPLLIGSGIADITPPLEVGLLMSSVERRWAPFERVRLPLHARALVAGTPRRRVAIVSLELLGLSEQAMGGMSRFRQRVVESSGRTVRDEDLLLASIHTHTAPETLALSDLHQTPAFQSWRSLLAVRIGDAIRMGVERLRPCSFSIAATSAPELGLHRRIKTSRGVLLSHPPPPPEIVLSREGAVDDSVHVAVFRDESDQVAALLVNAACHPVHEMCYPHVSPDYPGIMSRALERQFPGSHVLFLNGADGNVNPPTVSGGPAAAEAHGLRLAELVDSVLPDARPVEGTELGLARCSLRLPSRSAVDQAGTLNVPLSALRIGDAAFCFIPGEPFAETGLAIRERSPFRTTFVAGYAEGSIGYIPTDEAYREGGYETGPGAWSPLAPGCERVIRSKCVELLNQLHTSVRSKVSDAAGVIG